MFLSLTHQAGKRPESVWQAGFQKSGCVHALWNYALQQYIDFLVEHRFNAVRLPMSVEIIQANAVTGELCGEYQGWPTLEILDDVIVRLQRAGIFVMFDMHTLSIDRNDGYWCYPNNGRCAEKEEAPLWDAWETLARRYCSSPNVVAADLFNEPVSGNQ